MKRCPECRRDYYDDSLLYCLDDGSALLEGPAAADEAATALLSSSQVKETPTRRGLAASGDTDPFGAQQSGRPADTRWMTIFFPIAGLVLVIGAGFAFYTYYRSSRVPAARAFESTKISKLTSNGKATAAVISPDGKQLVYVVDDAGMRSLWLKQVLVTGSEVQIAAPEKVYYSSLSISPDGNFLYYAAGGNGPSEPRSFFQKPLLSGAPRKIVENVSAAIAFSPDGKQMAFARNLPEPSLSVALTDGTQERVVASLKRPDTFGNFAEGGVAWSPDGAKVAAIVAKSDSSGRYYSIVEFPLGGGTERPLTPDRWDGIERLAWLADGSGMIMTAIEQSSDPGTQRQLWRLSYSTGEAKRITTDLSQYEGVSLDANSNVLVSIQGELSSTVSILEKGGSGKAVQVPLTGSKIEGEHGVAWMPDGRIIYTSMASGNEAIWIADQDGKNKRQVTRPEMRAGGPSVSSSGDFIFFNAWLSGTSNIWKIKVDGSDAKQLTDGTGNVPQPTSDGKWVVYHSPGAGILKVPVDGGEPIPIFKAGASATLSPDTRYIAYSGRPTEGRHKLFVASIDGSEPTRSFDVPLDLPATLRWTPDSSAILFVARQDGVCDIWSQPVVGGEPKRVTDLKADQIFGFDWSRDNKLLIAAGSKTSDVVLIRNVQ